MDEGMLISPPATVRGNRGRFGAVLGCLHGLPTRLRTDYVIGRAYLEVVVETQQFLSAISRQ
jgi:hypothetical protein